MIRNDDGCSFNAVHGLCERARYVAMERDSTPLWNRQSVWCPGLACRVSGPDQTLCQKPIPNRCTCFTQQLVEFSFATHVSCANSLGHFRPR